MQGLLVRMSIKGLLTGALAIFAVLLSLETTLGYVGGVFSRQIIDEMHRVGVTQVDMISRADIQRMSAIEALSLHVDMSRRRGSVDAAERKAVLEESTEHITEAKSRLTGFLVVPPDAPERQFVDETSASFKALLDILDQQQRAVANDDFRQFDTLLEHSRTVRLAFEGAREKYLAHADAFDEKLTDQFESRYRTVTIVSFSFLALALLIVLFVRMGLTRLVIHPLGDAVQHVQRLAKADLSQLVETNLQNEVGQLLRAMREMQENLSSIVGTVRQSSGNILESAQHVSQGNQELSVRTEQQAASLQQTASSMEELTATVRQNADNALQASTLAEEASSTAGKGREVVLQVVGTMQGIQDSSQRIANIINVIDSIAFQTNILALNASVEAARAGEQGRGFAVVAGEVRSLANRSAEAAREIKALIEESSRQVHDGTQLAEQAGHTMSGVVSAVKRVTDIIDEISAASSEQSEGISLVNTAVAQMDQAIQQNTVLVQEAFAESRAMSEQANTLEHAVTLFRLRETHNRSAAVKRTKVKNVATSTPKPTTAASANEWETF